MRQMHRKASLPPPAALPGERKGRTLAQSRPTWGLLLPKEMFVTPGRGLEPRLSGPAGATAAPREPLAGAPQSSAPSASSASFSPRTARGECESVLSTPSRTPAWVPARISQEKKTPENQTQHSLYYFIVLCCIFTTGPFRYKVFNTL